MGYPTKVQLIQRKDSQQWYINFPATIAQGMDFSNGEDVDWTIADRGHLILSRKQVPPVPIDLKKTLRSCKSSEKAPGFAARSRLKICDTAECNSALRRKSSRHPAQWERGQKDSS